MNSAERLKLWIEQMGEAVGNACGFIEGVDFAAFQGDKRTQQAVVLNLLLIGEVASRIVESAPTFVAAHPEIPWLAMRGMRNRIAHGYFELDIKVVWDTVCSALPALAGQLPVLMQAAGEFGAE
ncbi:MAG: HepT-like ribonuclease domain-containing protein [Thauera sp.]